MAEKLEAKPGTSSEKIRVARLSPERLPPAQFHIKDNTKEHYRLRLPEVSQYLLVHKMRTSILVKYFYHPINRPPSPDLVYEIYLDPAICRFAGGRIFRIDRRGVAFSFDLQLGHRHA